VNRFIWPKPPAAGAAATVLPLPLNPSVAPPDLEDEDEERDLLRRKSIRFTSELLGLELEEEVLERENYQSKKRQNICFPCCSELNLLQLFFE
jgi:hypothetical protein